jgi:kumamolisin
MRPYFHLFKNSAKFRNAITPKPFTIKQVMTAYEFPTQYDGTGQTIGIVELGGGYNNSDLVSAGLKPIQFSALSIDGAKNAPTGDPSSADGEVALDVQIAGIVAPSAKVLTAFTTNTEQGFVDAVSGLVEAKATVISISWGASEDNWSTQGMTSLHQVIQEAIAQGITVCVAAGDSGYTDGEASGSHVEFPGSSPYSLCCGGTALYTSPTTNAWQNEYVWNDLSAGGGSTGGGISSVYKKLPHQDGCDYLMINGVPTATEWRLVPDVAANAAPATGYKVWIDGSEEVVGGTSAVAPLFAGLIALIQQANGAPIANLVQPVYAHRNTATEEAYFHESISGNNGLYQSVPHRFDCCTGLGSVNGTALLKLLTAK